MNYLKEASKERFTVGQLKALISLCMAFAVITIVIALFILFGNVGMFALMTLEAKYFFAAIFGLIAIFAGLWGFHFMSRIPSFSDQI